MGKSTEFYRKNRKARKKKQAYDAALNRKPEQVRRRVQLNRENRRRGNYGNGDNRDLAHTKNGLVYKDQSVNRGSTSDSPGDRRARGRRRR